MKIKALIFLVIFFAGFQSLLLGQSKDKCYIVWTDSLELSLSHFKKRTSSKNIHAAMHIEMLCLKDYSKDSLLIELYATMCPSKSNLSRMYLKKFGSDTTASNLIKHETIHLKIIEYHRRRFVKKILEIKTNSINRFDSKYSKLYFEIYKEMWQEQIKFDKEYVNAQIDDVSNKARDERDGHIQLQNTWDEYVDKKLLEYQDYQYNVLRIYKVKRKIVKESKYVYTDYICL